jgi:hypothetical protein
LAKDKELFAKTPAVAAPGEMQAQQQTPGERQRAVQFA